MKNLVVKIPALATAILLIVSTTVVASNSNFEESSPVTSFTELAQNEENSSYKVASSSGNESSIASIAINAGFDQLVGALQYVDEKLDAGLVNLFLNGTDKFTVFAPTNEAFEALLKALDVSGIRDLDAELVLNVLKYHVVSGSQLASAVVPQSGSREVSTLLGKSFKIDSSAQITDLAGTKTSIATADISASNGVIHVINGVLLPLE
jgi:uncharacterized surface protein with fasciclin (FAS1) repeats